MHQHHRFANSVALFQVAIALGAVAALTRVRLVWYGSIAVGVLRRRAFSHDHVVTIAESQRNCLAIKFTVPASSRRRRATLRPGDEIAHHLQIFVGFLIDGHV